MMQSVDKTASGHWYAPLGDAVSNMSKAAANYLSVRKTFNFLERCLDNTLHLFMVLLFLICLVLAGTRQGYVMVDMVEAVGRLVLAILDRAVVGTGNVVRFLLLIVLFMSVLFVGLVILADSPLAWIPQAGYGRMRNTPMVAHEAWTQNDASVRERTREMLAGIL